MTSRLLTALLTATLLGPAGAFAGEDRPVIMAGFSYLPGQDGLFGQARGALPVTLTIREGDVITGVNVDPEFHTITSGEPQDPDRGGLFDSGEVRLGEARTVSDVSALEPGEYPFHCRIHPAIMFGVLRVEPAGDMP